VRHDGSVTAYAQTITLRDPKASETNDAKRSVAASEVMPHYETQKNNRDYPDLKKKQMAEHERLTRLALSK
jgi:hypothetical protein